MPKEELNFGTVLVETMGIYSYTRISKMITPWNQTKFVITTEGLAVFSTETGWNPLDWDKIKEPDSSNGTFFGKFDLKGTIHFSTPISSVVTGKAREDIDSMPTEFYYKLIEARRIVRMFDKDKDLEVSWKDIALKIWAKDLKCRAGIPKEQYIKYICEWRITNELYRGNRKKQQLVLALFKKGLFGTGTFKQHEYECIKSIEDVMKNNEEIVTATEEEVKNGIIPGRRNTTGRENNGRTYDPSRWDRLKYILNFILFN